MKIIFKFPRIGKGVAFMVLLLSISVSGFTQIGQSASELASQMLVGWNLGNSLDVPGGETGWGNPATTQQLIDAVKTAGFNAIRIPCAWDSYSDASTYVIEDTWLARVKEVVDYCMNNDMYIIINIHWDGGWLEENPFYSVQDAVNAKQEAFWTQIASYFINYDEHLLFAGTNEVHADYGTPTSEYIEVQESYNQTFVDAVRATGGNNTSRNLIVQTYNTNMWHGLDYFTLPSDVVDDHLLVEVHYYDPYDFTLNPDNNSACTVWGDPWSSGDVCTWGQESYVEDLFNRVKQQFVDQGISVIIGEYGVVKRTSLTGDAYTQHIASRLYYLEYITDAAKRYGMVPFYWDNGYNGDMGLALFDRSTGSIVDQEALDAIMEGAGAGDPNANYTLTVSTSGSGTVSLNPSGGVYLSGTTVTVTATAASGWDFIGWSGDLSGSTNPATITMNSNKSITASFIEQGSGGSGSILREYWTGITGTAVTDLTSNANYPDNPSGSEEITSFEGPTDWADNYGTRIRGYIHPPVTGSYTFWVAGDDYTNLYLSTDDSPANASLIAYVEGWTNSQEWTKYTSQTATVNLAGGQRYYVEVLHKEGSGGDNVAVAWQGPTINQSVISGVYLSPYEGGTTNPDQFTLSTSVNGTGSISLNPAGGTYDAGTVVAITAIPGSGWQFDNWSGDISSTSNPVSVTMNSNLSMTANFSETTIGDICNNPTAISIPFTQDGVGEFCWSTAADIAYINSWNMDVVEVNGVDYTNTWSNSFPAKINGYYYIYYKGSYSWSHLEIPATKSATYTDKGFTKNSVMVYPNPFTESIHLVLNHPEEVKNIQVRDQLGRLIMSISPTSISRTLEFGQKLETGVYIIQITDDEGLHNYTIIKNK